MVDLDVVLRMFIGRKSEALPLVPPNNKGPRGTILPILDTPRPGNPMSSTPSLRCSPQPAAIFGELVPSVVVDIIVECSL